MIQNIQLFIKKVVSSCLKNRGREIIQLSFLFTGGLQ